MSGSDTQRRDVLEMLIANIERLDRRYLERWAAELGVQGDLEALWAEAISEG